MADSAQTAGELRAVLGTLVRRLRAERRDVPLAQTAVLGHLLRSGPASVSSLAAAERVRPQSMAATVTALLGAGHVTKRPDPGDRRSSLIELSDPGKAALLADRARREGWLADAIDRKLDTREQQVLAEATALLQRLSED